MDMLYFLDNWETCFGDSECASERTVNFKVFPRARVNERPALNISQYSRGRFGDGRKQL